MLHILNLREKQNWVLSIFEICDVIFRQQNLVTKKMKIFLLITAKFWPMDVIFIYMLYLGNLPSAGKNFLQKFWF